MVSEKRMVGDSTLFKLLLVSINNKILIIK